MIISDLSTYTAITANKSPRYKDIGAIVVHFMADDGHFSGAGCADYFVQMGATGQRQCSSNYCIGGSGDIACSVPEEYRAWTSGSEWADQQAITIEVSCTSNATGEITQKAWNALVALCTDICERYDITPSYTGDTAGTLWEHRYFQSTNCPGDYLHRNMSRLAAEIQAQLDHKKAPKPLGWVLKDGKWTYHNEFGEVWDEWIDEGGKSYFIKPDHTMAAGEFIQWGGEWYYLGADGAMVTDRWIKHKDKWYYLKKLGGMAEDEWIWDGSYGAWYFLGKQGAMVTGWIEWHGDWYYLKSNGKMASGEWVKDKDKYYYCYPTGKMARSEEVDGYKVNAKGERLTP